MPIEKAKKSERYKHVIAFIIAECKEQFPVAEGIYPLGSDKDVVEEAVNSFK